MDYICIFFPCYISFSVYLNCGCWGFELETISIVILLHVCQNQSINQLKEHTILPRWQIIFKSIRSLTDISRISISLCSTECNKSKLYMHDTCITIIHTYIHICICIYICWKPILPKLYILLITLVEMYIYIFYKTVIYNQSAVTKSHHLLLLMFFDLIEIEKNIFWSKKLRLLDFETMYFFNGC